MVYTIFVFVFVVYIIVIDSYKQRDGINSAWRLS